MPLGPAMAWPAKVPTTISASAGIAARRISSKIRLRPPITVRKNHEDVMKASEKNALVENPGINLWISAA